MRWWRCCGGWLLRERLDEAVADAPVSPLVRRYLRTAISFLLAGLGRQKEYPLKHLTLAKGRGALGGDKRRQRQPTPVSEVGRRSLRLGGASGALG